MKICINPFFSVQISVDGVVSTCSQAFIKWSIGNWLTTPFDEIWNGEKAREIRRLLLNGSNECCRNLCSPIGNPQVDEVSFAAHDYELSEIMPLPKVVKINGERDCPIACVMCREEVYRNSPERNAQLEARIPNLVSFCQNADIVCLTGSGEPTTSPFIEKLIYAICKEYPKIRFIIYTNGLNATSERFKVLGIENRIAKIEFTLHAFNKITYDKIVSFGDFERARKNLHMLIGGGYEVSLFFIISSLNYMEIPDYVNWSSGLGLRNCYFINAHYWPATGKNGAKLIVSKETHPEYTRYLHTLKSLSGLKDNFSFTYTHAPSTIHKGHNIHNILNKIKRMFIKDDF